MSAPRIPLRETACVVVLSVGFELTEASAAKLSPRRLVEFASWAACAHLRASDNIVRMPPRPDWLPAAWQGLDDEWGRGPTPISDEHIAKAAESEPATVTDRHVFDHLRALWRDGSKQTCTPLRLGMFMVDNGMELANPYPPGTRGASGFDEGVGYAKAAHAALAAKSGSPS